MEDFKSTVIETSRDLTKREKLMVKNTTDATKLDELIQPGEQMVISPDFYVVLDTHNERSERKDYKQFIIVDKGGNKFYTGSESFWRSFIDIYEEMTGEDYEIKVFKKESKNYKGKHFLTCSIV